MATLDPIHVLSDALGRTGDELVCAYVFGSVARGSALPTSDVDVAVLLRTIPEDPFDKLGLRLAGDLERSIRCPVDVVVLNRAPVDLVHRVLRDGIIVLDRDPAARIRFEVSARNAYFDLKPHLDRYRRAALQG